ncbi:hypothetical protein HF086_000828 [Spodoptera exigua]|uniref:Uncharacterized protein n=1 Tax=Spodoptera exigua TaxID=7107 RepID=A0A922MF17_SPOEX|nr:hypothetical protein HF086_000828 [Spodoptera exigua]
MSETDDTDILLLIPPNFFLVQSSESENSLLESSRTVVHKPKSCTAQVLGKLVDQVHTLESRLESLEFNSDTSSFGTVRRPKTWDTTDSIDSQSLDRKCFTFPRRRKRKTTKKSKRFDLSLSGLDSESIGRKSIPPLKLDVEFDQLNYKPIEIINEIQSMDGDISSIVSTPTKKNDKLLLHEIDEFLTKVESYETPDTKYKDHEPSLSPENVIKATGDYISQKLDSKSNEEEVKLPSGRMVPSSILDKYIYLVKSNSGTARSEKPTTSENYKSNNEETGTTHPNSTLKESTESCSREARTPSMRKLNFSDKDVQPTSTPKRPQSSYLDTFRPSSNKIYDRASKVLEQYKSQSQSRNQGSANESYLAPKKEEFKMPQMRPYCYNNKDAKLSSLQNKFMESIDTDLLSLSELWGDRGDRPERIDSHCESMIQQLQKKILEQQEKLAVAVKVDRAKDAAIGKLREAWLKLTGNLDKAEERHRAALEKMVREVENFRMIADEAQKKTNHFEAELYKALDLAHDYQEKCKQLTTEKKDIDEKIQMTIQERDEMVAKKEKEVEALKENCQTIMRLNKQSSDCIKNLEEALEKEKSDHHETKCKIKELANKIQSLEDTNALVAQERDLLKEKDNLETEVKTLRKHLELQKTELKCHYQKQLEDAVLSKLQEFQQQLDVAERDMEADARAKENALIDTYNKQISRIEEQHKLEINVMEEKQREEIKLYRLQLAQAGEKIGLLELHAVMQAQCRAALRLLTHGDARVSEYTKIPPLTLPERGLVRSEARSDNRTDNHSDERMDGRSDERNDKLNFDGLTDAELQHGDMLELHRELSEEPTSDRPDRSDTAERPEQPERRDKRRLSKPPWKA